MVFGDRPLGISLWTKQAGSGSHVELPSCEKLVDVAWKKYQLWYLTRPFRDGEVPETYAFREDNALGVEKDITIKEMPCK